MFFQENIEFQPGPIFMVTATSQHKRVALKIMVLALLAHIRLGWQGLTGTNALAYFGLPP